MKLLTALAIVFSAQSAFAGIDYFGYYGSASAGLYDASAAVAPNSNLVFIRGATTAEVVQKLAEAQRLGLSAIVDVQTVLFPWQSSLVCTAATCGVDYLTAFYLFHEAIKAYDNVIAAYYIFDEPYWNNYLASVGQIPNYAFTYNSNFYWQLYSAIYAVHTYAPGKPTAIIFSFAEMQGNGAGFQWLIPSNLDWMGFDGYAATGCDANCATVNFEYLAAVSSRTGQKLIAVPDSVWTSPPSVTIENGVVQRIQLWKELIYSRASQVVAVMPFLYQSAPSQNLYGADSMPQVANCLATYYQQLRGYAVCSGTTLVDLLNPTITCPQDISCQ